MTDILNDVHIQTVGYTLWAVRPGDERKIHPAVANVVQNMINDLNHTKRNCCQNCMIQTFVCLCAAGCIGLFFCGLGIILLLIALILLPCFICTEGKFQDKMAKKIKNYEPQFAPYYTVFESLSDRSYSDRMEFVIVLRPTFPPGQMPSNGINMQQNYMGGAVEQPTYSGQKDEYKMKAFIPTGEDAILIDNSRKNL